METVPAGAGPVGDTSPEPCRPKIDYAPPPPGHRRRWLRRAIILLLLGLGAVAGLLRGKPLYEWVRERYRWHRCLTFTRPADFVALETDARSAAALARGPEYVTWVYNNGSSPPAAAFRGPTFASPPPEWQSGGPVVPAQLFLHRRRWPGGPERLVTVHAQGAGFASPWASHTPLLSFEFHSWRTDLPLGAPGAKSEFGDEDEGIHIGLWPGIGGRSLRIFYGQPDPDDESHFTICYEMDGKRGTMDGYLRSPRPIPAPVFGNNSATVVSESVDLSVRDGPAKLLPAPPPTAASMEFGPTLPACRDRPRGNIALVDATALGTFTGTGPEFEWKTRLAYCLLQITHVYWGADELLGKTSLYLPDVRFSGNFRGVGIDYMPVGTKGIWTIHRIQVKRPAAAGIGGGTPGEPEATDETTADAATESEGTSEPPPGKPQSIWVVRPETAFDDVPILEFAGPIYQAVKKLAWAIEAYRRTIPADATRFLEDEVIHGPPDVSRWALDALDHTFTFEAEGDVDRLINDGNIPTLRARLQIMATHKYQLRGGVMPGHDAATLLRHGLKVPLIPEDQAWLQQQYPALDKDFQPAIRDLLTPPSTHPVAATLPATPF